MTLWTLHAAYDPEAHVWYTLNCDVPGLITEGETIEDLRKKATDLVPELLELNAEEIGSERLAGPHFLRLVAFHESTVSVAV